MAISSLDITFTFSGGTTNVDPDNSLGGEPSLYPIVNKRLFDDVSDEQTKAGMIDYRCFYVNNESNIYSLYDAMIYVAYTVPGDVTVQIGFDFQNERQNLTILNAEFITGGSVSLTYTDASNYDVTINWDANLANFSNNLQTALRNIPNLEDVTVSGLISQSNIIFEIDFVGSSSKRYHELITLNENNLTSSQPTSISILKSINGGPINRIADVIDVETTNPNNITFDSSVFVGDIRPLDSIPIWVKRIVPANTSAMENDGFVLRIKGQGVKPS
jgi:hypothetical protein